MIAGVFDDPKELQFEFLLGLHHERFMELQKLTGAHQGQRKANRNQLLDVSIFGALNTVTVITF